MDDQLRAGYGGGALRHPFVAGREEAVEAMVMVQFLFHQADQIGAGQLAEKRIQSRRQSGSRETEALRASQSQSTEGIVRVEPALRGLAQQLDQKLG